MTRPRWWLWLLRSNPWSRRSFARRAAWDYEQMISRRSPDSAQDGER